MVKRIFVQKREGFDVETKEILNDLRENLNLSNLEDLKIFFKSSWKGARF